MRRGFVAGAVAGAILSIAAGVVVAVLPSTPTWALWRLKHAIDANDADQISRMVDIASVTQRAVDELDGRDGLDLGQLAAVVIGGGKVTTVFTDPDHPLEISGEDVLSAWWGMRRDGDLAYLTLPTGEKKTVDLILGNQPSKGWRIVGITPIAALLRVQPRERGKAPASATSPVSHAIDPHRDEG